jgi:hypothetical protein
MKYSDLDGIIKQRPKGARSDCEYFPPTYLCS